MDNGLANMVPMVVSIGFECADAHGDEMEQ
jgi:hypothetical protein